MTKARLKAKLDGRKTNMGARNNLGLSIDPLIVLGIVELEWPVLCRMQSLKGVN